jgi:hypothetical protein
MKNTTLAEFTQIINSNCEGWDNDKKPTQEHITNIWKKFEAYGGMNWKEYMRIVNEKVYENPEGGNCIYCNRFFYSLDDLIDWEMNDPEGYDFLEIQNIFKNYLKEVLGETEENAEQIIIRKNDEFRKSYYESM